MILTSQEADQFYRIWFPLMSYVNKRYKFLDQFDEYIESNRVPPEKILPIRKKLWTDDTLLDSFISENPAKLSDDDLDIVAGWKYRIMDTFFIYKFLVKHTIFILDKTPPLAYGVHGLRTPIEEMLSAPIPIMVEAVLLPFRDKIITDGFIESYRLYFGSGYRQNLAIAYRDAKEKKGIITSLIPKDQVSSSEQIKESYMEKNRLILKAFNKFLFKSGLSAKMVQQHTEAIEEFANRYLLDLAPPRLLLDIDCGAVMGYWDKGLVDTKKKKASAVSIKRFIRFLYETDRMDVQDYREIYDFLKAGT